MKAEKRAARVVAINAQDASALDTLTLAALSVHAVPVLSAVHPFAALPADLVVDQLTAALTHPVDALKIGDPGARAVFALEEQLIDFQTRPDCCRIVLDPELEDRIAGPRHGGQTRRAIREHLCRLADVLVVNATEAHRLGGRPVRTPNDAREACKRLFDLGAPWIVLGGGRMEDHAIDRVYDGRDFVEFGADRLPRQLTGVGAVFSAAITGYLGRGLEVLAAVEAAKAVAHDAVLAALPGDDARPMPVRVEGLDACPVDL